MRHTIARAAVAVTVAVASLAVAPAPASAALKDRLGPAAVRCLCGDHPLPTTKPAGNFPRHLFR
ncbi:hypothetical protein [Micromonospora sp. NPDC047730]|uniref:hypothetical protein n=1 Tax=Micromonospora sp. NPDC047730 TaxID=3364253 RepID=UPI003715E927